MCYFVTFQQSPIKLKCTWPSIFTSLDFTREEFSIFVLQPATCSVDNILIVNKFPSFYEFLQFR